MSDIFYSEVDENLQKELNSRAYAGRYDRSDASIAYMTEKVANVQLTAYAEGSKRNKDKVVHTLGGKSVLTGEFLPTGDYGYLTTRQYTLKETRWAAVEPSMGDIRIAQIQGKPEPVKVKENSDEHSYNNDSYRIPPHITSADLQINDNSRGLTNKATINIIIPNPDRDLNFMESIYARPGRYCLLEFEHPESALLTLTGSRSTGGMLTTNSLPSLEIIKARHPEAAADFDSLRKMNKVQFEGVITSFEYAYQTDGTISMTIYILGTSMVYTDLSLLMQTATNDAPDSETDDFKVDKATSFSQYIADKVYNAKVAQGDAAGAKMLLIDGYHKAIEFQPNENGWFAWGQCGDGVNRDYINLNALMNAISTKILSKIPGDGTLTPAIYCDEYNNVFANPLPYLCSADPADIWIPRAESTEKRISTDSDTYGVTPSGSVNGVPIPWLTTTPPGFLMNPNEQKAWETYVNNTFINLDTKELERLKGHKQLGRPGCIMICVDTIQKIITTLAGTKDEFTVKEFLTEISSKISFASGGAINMQLVTDPVVPEILYFRDINWIGSPDSVKEKIPYEIPMFQNHPIGTIVRDFKFSAKLPSSVQSLMYTLNSTQAVSEEKIAPYIRFMYNNAAVTRNGNVETSIYGNKELIQKLATEYLALHLKYKSELLTAKQEFGSNFSSEEKRIALADALRKYVQYPKPTIEESCINGPAPVFPFDVEFTIDGINGFRYGDILDFPGLPAKYKTQTTFTIKGLVHTISNTGEWTTRITCMMRPKF
jgi:hypothetical protein